MKAFPVRRPPGRGCVTGANGTAEEFNKYLSYVRNLGFEDTPDYDFLRDLFTQALKSTGEVEDGEYDWMKLNGGRGWDALKAHPSAHHLHNINGPPDASARALHGAAGVRGIDGRPSPRDRAAVSADRLNAAQPPPPGSPAKPGVAALGKSAPDRTSAAGGANLPKRSSGLAGQLDMGTPTASTQAQFQNSNANLVTQPPRASPANAALQSSQQRPPAPPEPQPSSLQKLMKILCCGM